MDKEFVISYLKTRNYWWQTREIAPADKGIPRQEYIEKIRAIEKLVRDVAVFSTNRFSYKGLSERIHACIQLEPWNNRD